MTPPSQQFRIPDLLAMCPLKKGETNPHYEAAAKESSDWVNAYNIFRDRKRAFFIQGSNELLVSCCYPYAGYEEFRTCCDFVNLLFVVDEVSDDQCGKDARKTGEIFLKAMLEPDWHDGSNLCKMTKEFRARFTALAAPACLRRFLDHCVAYIECVSREAELREKNVVLPLSEFTPLRRENSAIRLCFGLFEYARGLDLPDEVFENPVFMSLYWAAADMVCWANDLYSYNMEQAKGHSGNNVVTVLMRDNKISLQEASNRVGSHFWELMDRFVKDKERLPSWGEHVDAQVQKYVDAMGHWVIGNLEWSFMTKRYFGPAHDQVKKTLCVTLKPRDIEEDPSEMIAAATKAQYNSH